MGGALVYEVGMRFEYKYLELRYTLTGGWVLHDLKAGTKENVGRADTYGIGLVNAFDKYGQDGWELVGFCKSDALWEYIFKRRRL